MTFGINLKTLLIVGVVGWVVYGSFKGGQAYASVSNGNSYAAKT